MRHHWFFDLDGTLFDTEEDIRLAWKASLAALHRPCPHFDEVYVTGPSIDDMVARFFPDERDLPALAAAVRAQFVQVYDNGGFPTTVPYEHSLRWLNELKNAGAHVYVATNKRLNPTRKILAKFDLLDFFDGVYASDMFRGVPNPPPGIPNDRMLKKPAFLAYALRAHGIEPADAVMVGDTHLDVEAGKANGLYTIGVAWGYGSEAELAAADEVRK